MKKIILCVFLLACMPTFGDEDVKAMSGMSVLGNNEAPKSLVIVPWKSSELGDGLWVDNLVNERASPIDKEVFLRELSYYQLRTSAGQKGEVQD